ncbi:MAG: TetM/TetW/TetO/TetS family tetracycline resistance ribosomal protection protein [Bacilli bacterium]|nr:TetM/TetW/TetO/TetS family tetracycline resistance ribosomal protection protein [Bacilli bacterium]
MSKDIMTLGVFAHANAGKTTISEQLLVHTDVKKNTGRVDYGNTTTDNLKVEKERGISVRASLVTIPLKDRTIQLIDTPGHVDFSAEVERAISVLDGAILVVSGVEGIEPQTQVIWNILKERNVPTLIFINKMDRLGADYDRTLKELQEKLDPRILPRVRVIKGEDGLLYEDVHPVKIIEEIADIDEGVLDKYVNNEQISVDWLESRIKRLSQGANAFYVYGGSALLDEGIKRLINGIEEYLPVSRGNKNDEFSGYVYTVKRDAGVRELYVKVLAGSLSNREEILNGNGSLEKIRTMSKIDGFSKVKVDEISTGDIGIITGIDAKCGDIIGNTSIDFNPIMFVNPLFQTTVRSERPEDVIKLVEVLSVLSDEDPQLQPMFNKQTGEITIKLMGLLQGEIVKNQIEERFGLRVVLSDPIIVHKETPIRVGIGTANYTRVSGVSFETKPLPRGSGLVYHSKFSTDYLFPKYQKQVERLVYQYAKQGLFGWEVTDAEISLVDGKCDNVGSDPSHFNVAVPVALMRSFKDANMQLLEPVMSYEITSPKEYFKPLFSLASNHGVSYDNIEKSESKVKIRGIAPLRELMDLPATVTRLSSGTGTIIQKPNGYVEYKGDKILEKRYIGPDPRNESTFLMEIGASGDNLDAKRRK